MPAIYAHERFGNLVLKELDEEKQRMIKKYRIPYGIGLQGPDYLFFYKALKKNRVNQTGYILHEKPAKAFLKHAVSVVRKYGFDSPEYSYALGFICHFALDSECHPFVDAEIQRTGVGHIEIESEYEKYLLRMDGVEPLSFPIGDLVPTDRKTVECIRKFYPDIAAKEAADALKDMKRIKSILVAPKAVKRTVIDTVMKLSGQYEALQGHLLKPEDNPKCRKTNEGLYERTMGAIPVAVMLMNDFQAAVRKEKELCERFDRNFE